MTLSPDTFPPREPSAAMLRALFAGFVVLHIAVWTALPLAFTDALPVDVVEGVIWGQGWQLGYDQPPLQAWLLGSANWLFDYQRWAVYLLSQLLVAISVWAVWRLGRWIVSPLGALVSVLLLEGVLFFNLVTPNLFPDLIEMPLWALAAWSFYRALRFGLLKDWAILGVLLAATAYGKYVGAVLASVMVGFMLAEPYARRCWRTPGPYLCAGLCVLLLVPHLWWGLQHDFPTIERFHESAKPTDGVLHHLLAFAGFTGGQLAIVLPAALLTIALVGFRRGAPRLSLRGAPTPFDRRFVATLALGPFLVTVLAAALTTLNFRVHWGQAMWCLSGLFTVVFLVPTADRAGLRRFGGVWAGLFLVIALVYAGSNSSVSYVRSLGFPVLAEGSEAEHVMYRMQREADYPAQDLADAVTNRWHEKVGDRLAYVVGNKWVAGNIAFFSPDHPLVVRDGRPEDSPWIDAETLRRRGAVIVWDLGHDSNGISATLQRRFPMMELQPPLALPWKTDAKVPPVRIMWGIVYPSEASGLSPSVPAEGPYKGGILVRPK